MASFETIPDGWTETTYEVGDTVGNVLYTESVDAEWNSDSDPIGIVVTTEDSSDGVEYIIDVEQTIECNGLSYTEMIYTDVVDDRRILESDVVDLMNEIDTGDHRIHAFDVDVPDENPFVQFYTVSDSEMVGDTTADTVVETLTDEEREFVSEVSDETITNAPRDKRVRIAVLPVHKSRVSGLNE